MAQRYAYHLTILVLLAAIIISVYPAGAADDHRPAAVLTPVPTPVFTSVPPIGTVNTQGLNMHAGPDYSYARLEVTFRDWEVTLLGRDGSVKWLLVRAHNGKVGWVEITHITTSYPIVNLPDATRPGFVLAASPVQPTGATQPTYAIQPTGATQPTYTTQPTIAGQRTHLVLRGENLFRISLRYGVNMYTLARVNGIVNINLIYAGQVLIIP